MKLFPLLLTAFLPACYTYAPATPAALQPGMGVRVRVNASTAERVAPLLGATDARVLSGKLIDNPSGTLIVEVPTVVQTGVGSATQSLYQRISLAPAEIVELESRRLDRARTTIVVGAAAAVAGSVAIAALRSNPGLDHPPSGSSTDSRIPLLRLHF